MAQSDGSSAADGQLPLCDLATKCAATTELPLTASAHRGGNLHRNAPGRQEADGLAGPHGFDATTAAMSAAGGVASRLFGAMNGARSAAAVS